MVVHEIETTVNGAVRRAEVEPRLTLADFRGKLLLLDFWTYG